MVYSTPAARSRCSGVASLSPNGSVVISARGICGPDKCQRVGVGLPNIRDRLIQAFGERQRFETRSTQSGFSVIIEIPLNMDETSKVAA